MGLEQRRGHLKHRLVGEEHRPLGHRANSAGEAQLPERFQQGVREAVRAPEVGEVVGVEPEVLEEPQDVVQPGCDEESPARRHMAGEETERDLLRVDPGRDVRSAIVSS